MSNFTNRKWQSEEELEKIINNSQESEFSDNNSQSCYVEASSENVNRSISYANGEYDCSDDEETENAYGQKQGLIFLLL